MGYQQAHAAHIRHLACACSTVWHHWHDYGAWERELLQAAAILHDIGMVIKYNDHHKYSQRLSPPMLARLHVARNRSHCPDGSLSSQRNSLDR
jgi:23S rRNA maturation-related 3'-5' exoribonuclease YhaM